MGSAHRGSPSLCKVNVDEGALVPEMGVLKCPSLLLRIRPPRLKTISLGSACSLGSPILIICNGSSKFPSDGERQSNLIQACLVIFRRMGGSFLLSCIILKCFTVSPPLLRVEQ